MKKFFCIILSLLTIVSLCACGSATENSSNASSEGNELQSSDISETSEPVYSPEPVINGVKLSEFVLVYKETNDCAQYKAVAQEIAAYTQETFGFDMTFRSERLPEAENEIIIGLPATRKICSEYRTDYGYGGYKMAINGTKVVLAGSYANGCHFAFEELKKAISESEGGVLSDTVSEGEKEVIKVACVGDSITQGINSADNINKIYPVYLQGMLGWNYFVLNAGISGYSIVKTDIYAYSKSAQYNSAKRLVPDVVIFNLGTNDANPGQDYKSWDIEGREELFLESTRELLDSFYEVNPDCQIFLCYPSSLFKVGNDQWKAVDWTAGVETHVRPLLEQIVEEYELPTVDFWEWSKENSYVYTDGLHPKDETYEPYARHIYDNIKDTIVKPE